MSNRKDSGGEKEEDEDEENGEQDKDESSDSADYAYSSFSFFSEEKRFLPFCGDDNDLPSVVRTILVTSATGGKHKIWAFCMRINNDPSPKYALLNRFRSFSRMIRLSKSSCQSVSDIGGVGPLRLSIEHKFGPY